MSISIARRGELVYEEGFGTANQKMKVRVTPSCLFRIASVTKPITSVCIFSLIEQGRLKLDDLIFGNAGILGEDFGGPRFKPHVEDVRIIHLLTHSGGGWQNDDTDPMFRFPRMGHSQLIRWTIANLPLTYPPGLHYAYSNFGYCVLGRVIEKVTQQPYDKYVQQAVLAKCGISDMRIGGNTLAEKFPDEVIYYGQAGEDPYDMNVRRMDSHGGWVSTASDLVRFATHVDGLSVSRDILSQEWIRVMTTPTTANPGYAKGWAVNSAPNWWHVGSLPGTTTILVRTQSGFCWAALTNTRPKDRDLGGALDDMMWRLVRQVREWNA